MYKRLLVVSRDYNQARHWAKEQRMSPGSFVYVSSYYNIMGNGGSEYVMLDGWKLRPDAIVLQTALVEHACVERVQPTAERL